MKELARRGLELALSPAVRRRLYRVLLRDSATVFMLHRFEDPDRGVRGLDPERLKEVLRLLRDNGNPILSLRRMIRLLGQGDPLPAGSVVFTVDDGYYDFYRRGLPIFEDFECPVTAFLPTGFLDGEVWLWWDRVPAALGAVPHAQGNVRLEATGSLYEWDAPSARSEAANRIVADLHELEETARRSALRELEERLAVNLPPEPPERYAPMTWQEVRDAAGRGATFGPHTVTHPILSTVGDDTALREIGGSWRRLQEETDAVVPCLCYPNGSAGTFGPRSARIARDVGLSGALTTVPGHVHSRSASSGRDFRYRLPRYPFPTDRVTLLQVVSGITRVKRRVRRWGSLGHS